MNTEPTIARDAGPMNENEAIMTLDWRANQAAHRGDYGLHDDLRKVAELIERMAEARDDMEAEMENLRASLIVARGHCDTSQPPLRWTHYVGGILVLALIFVGSGL